MARITLSTHWKFQRLARTLGSKVLARGILETIWEPCWVAGDAYCGTSEDIEALCEWKGEPGGLTKMLLMPDAKKAGFIELYEGSVRDGSGPHYQVHDFLHHCPDYVRRRRDRELELTAPRNCVVCGDEYFSRAPNSQVCGGRCRQQLYRDRRGKPEESSEPQSDPPPDTDERYAERYGSRYGRDVTLQHSHSHTQYVPSTPVQVRTTTAAAKNRAATATAIDPDMEVDDVVAPSPQPTPSPAPRTRKASDPPLDTSPVVLTFPVTGQGGPSWDLHEAQVTRWATLYPTLDVLGEARQALAWIEADRTRRKTAGGMAKCLVSWLNRSVDRPHARGPMLITGSLKTAGNKAALEEVLRRRGHVLE